MDDQTFKKEVLERLDQIIELLGAALPEACLVEAQAEPEPTESAASPPADPLLYLVKDEMDEAHALAVEKWRVEKDSAGR